MAVFTASRSTVAAQAVGLARAALDDGRPYGVERRQFGRSIADLQARQFLVPEMATQVGAARPLS